MRGSFCRNEEIYYIQVINNSKRRTLMNGKHVCYPTNPPVVGTETLSGCTQGTPSDFTF